MSPPSNPINTVISSRVDLVSCIADIAANPCMIATTSVAGAVLQTSASVPRCFWPGVLILQHNC